MGGSGMRSGWVGLIDFSLLMAWREEEEQRKMEGAQTVMLEIFCYVPSLGP